MGIVRGDVDSSATPMANQLVAALPKAAYRLLLLHLEGSFRSNRRSIATRRHDVDYYRREFSRLKILSHVTLEINPP